MTIPLMNMNLCIDLLMVFGLETPSCVSAPSETTLVWFYSGFARPLKNLENPLKKVGPLKKKKI
jgi:hypothetical protein